ncbi:hypothetical protein R3P38DRAFT_3228820 [Favolaschia claudopus]|uniref:Uncharacterized protein n=1 Tax=Favolaschia claudopus TaxID=2862362 RepID=A0AAV9ZPX1_9AGAR
MSTAKRNNLSAENLVRCAQLNQYWRYGYGRQEVKNHVSHQVRLELPTFTRQPTDPKRARIPTLDDLLNPTPPADSDVPIDLDSVFNLRSNDPLQHGRSRGYIWLRGRMRRISAHLPSSNDLPGLKIETYIDLNAPKLKPKAATTSWTAESSKWNAKKW